MITYNSPNYRLIQLYRSNHHYAGWSTWILHRKLKHLADDEISIKQHKEYFRFLCEIPLDHPTKYCPYLDVEMPATKDVQVRPDGNLVANVAVADVGQVVLVLCEPRGGRVVARVGRLRVQGVRVGVELVADARLPRVVVGSEGRGRRAAQEGV